MKKEIHFLLSIVIIAYCCSCRRTTGIFPSPHPLRDVNTIAVEGNNKTYHYKEYDLVQLRKEAQNNERLKGSIKEWETAVAEIISMSDDEIRNLVGQANTMRALMVHSSGCPVHGKLKGHNFDVFKIDLSHPHHIQCPIGGEWYPNEDFPDDGMGWLDDRPGNSAKGEPFYFVGHYQMRFLIEIVPQQLKNLGNLWLYTGDELYSHKAAVLLERYCEIFKDLDPNDVYYRGKRSGGTIISHGYMEGSYLRRVTQAVDLLSLSLPDSLLDMVYSHVYRKAFEAYKLRPQRGNSAQDWNEALAIFFRITRDPEILNVMLFNHPGCVIPVLDNQFFRDGFAYEASLAYGHNYPKALQVITEELGDEYSRWIWDHPHLKQFYNAYADIMCLDRFTPFCGDMGNPFNTGYTLGIQYVQTGYNHYKTAKIAKYLVQAGSHDEDVIKLASQASPMKSTLAPVRGLAILRTGEKENRTALFMDYGFAHAAHSHADRLNINLYSFGREFINDMGYPEFMDSTAPGTGGWTTHTAGHVTVEVNEKRQGRTVFGDLHAFIVNMDSIRFIDASCEDAYAHCDVDLYRRQLALIETPHGPYVVDIFRIRGGSQHDYLFHGTLCEVSVQGVKFSPPQKKGTLAGGNIAWGYKPETIKPYGIENSGYQYLFNVQESSIENPCKILWKMNDGVTFNVFFIPDGRETFYKADAYVKPATRSYGSLKVPEYLTPKPIQEFFIRRKIQTKISAESHFVTVMSAQEKSPFINSTKMVKLSNESDPSAKALLIEYGSGTDLIMSTLSEEGFICSSDGTFIMRGHMGIASWRNHRLSRMILIGGTSFSINGKTVTLNSPTIETYINQVSDNKLVLEQALPSECVGQVLLAYRGPVQSAYWINHIEDKTVFVSPTTWIGRGRVDEIDNNEGIIIDKREVYPLGNKSEPTGYENNHYKRTARNYYSGAWLTDENGKKCYRIARGGNDGFVLDRSQNLTKISDNLPIGSQFLIYDLGPGDKVKLIKITQKYFN